MSRNQGASGYCFQLSEDFKDPRSISYRLSQDTSEPSPLPPDRWNSDRDLNFETDYRFDAKTRAALPHLRVLINPIKRELPSIIGNVYPSEFKVPLIVDGQLKRAIEQYGPDLCDFVPLGKNAIWATTFECDMPSADYFFMSVLPRAHTWDPDLNDISKMTRSDGTTFHMIAFPNACKRSAVANLALWYEAQTDTLLCSEAFRQILLDAGAVGLSFRKVALSDA